MLTAWLKEGNFVPRSLWKAASPQAYLATCFVLKIMRTLQAVRVFCLKIPTRGFLWLSVPDSCRAESGFAGASAVTHACWGLCAIRGNILNAVRNPFTLGTLSRRHNFDKLFKLRFFLLKFWEQWHMLTCLALTDLRRSKTELVTGLWRSHERPHEMNSMRYHYTFYISRRQIMFHQEN